MDALHKSDSTSISRHLSNLMPVSLRTLPISPYCIYSLQKTLSPLLPSISYPTAGLEGVTTILWPLWHMEDFSKCRQTKLCILNSTGQNMDHFFKLQSTQALKLLPRSMSANILASSSRGSNTSNKPLTNPNSLDSQQQWPMLHACLHPIMTYAHPILLIPNPTQQKPFRITERWALCA